MSTAAVFGLAGARLGTEEAAFFRDVRPWGFILFRRNVDAPDEVRRLCDELRASLDDAGSPILVDQEGGRVQRLGPPHWRALPSARAYGALREPAAEEAARLGARLIAHDLAAVGINVDCMPVLDVPASGAHDVIGDRAYDDDPERVARMGRAVCEGLLAGGVLPVLKHVPGHGRGGADSHHALPVVEAPLAELEARDFAPFKALCAMPLAMSAHVVFTALDAARPATTSPAVIERAIRGAIGFAGLLLSDDLSMNALAGPVGERARAALAAGCDVALHCNGDLSEMKAVAAASGALPRAAADRAAAALARIASPEPFDPAAGWSRLQTAFAGKLAA